MEQSELQMYKTFSFRNKSGEDMDKVITEWLAEGRKTISMARSHHYIDQHNFCHYISIVYTGKPDKISHSMF